MYKIIHYVLVGKNIPKTLEFFKASNRVQAGASHLNFGRDYGSTDGFENLKWKDQKAENHF